jgi:hypothetical protein
MRVLQAQFDRTPFPVLDLGGERCFQVMEMRMVLLAGFFCQRGVPRADS